MSTLLAAVALAGCNKPVEEQAEAPVVVSTMALCYVKARQVRDVQGRVSALRSVEVRPQVGGIVVTRLFEQGTKVSANQPLYRLDNATYRAEAAVAQAAAERARAAVRSAEAHARRLERLVTDRIISQQDLENAQLVREQSQADLSEALAQLDRKRLDLHYSTITAPISGRVDESFVSEGALVSPMDAQPMTRIHQLDTVYVDARLPLEHDTIEAAAADSAGAASVLAGVRAASGQGPAVPGRVLFSGTTVDAHTGDVLLKIEVDNADARFLPGMFVRVRLEGSNTNEVLAVPEQAIVRSAKGDQLWIVDDAGRAHARTVVLGDRTGDGMRIVSGEVEVQDTVVVEGHERVSEGIQVEQRAWQAPGSTTAAVH